MRAFILSAFPDRAEGLAFAGACMLVAGLYLGSWGTLS